MFYDGIAALLGKDEQRAHDGNKLVLIISGYDFHYEKLKKGIRIMPDFYSIISNMNPY